MAGFEIEPPECSGAPSRDLRERQGKVFAMKRTIVALIVSAFALAGAAASAQADSGASEDSRRMIQLGFDWV